MARIDVHRCVGRTLTCSVNRNKTKIWWCLSSTTWPLHQYFPPCCLIPTGVRRASAYSGDTADKAKVLPCCGSLWEPPLRSGPAAQLCGKKQFASRWNGLVSVQLRLREQGRRQLYDLDCHTYQLSGHHHVVGRARFMHISSDMI